MEEKIRKITIPRMGNKYVGCIGNKCEKCVK